MWRKSALEALVMPSGARFKSAVKPQNGAGTTSPAGAALSWFESSVKSSMSKFIGDDAMGAKRMQGRRLAIAIDRMHAAFGIDRIRKPSASSGASNAGAFAGVGAPESELAPLGPSWMVGRAITGAYKRLTFAGKQQILDGNCDTRASLAVSQGYIGDDIYRPVCSYEIYILVTLAIAVSDKASSLLKDENDDNRRAVNLRFLADIRNLFALLFGLSIISPSSIGSYFLTGIILFFAKAATLQRRASNALMLAYLAWNMYCKLF